MKELLRGLQIAQRTVERGGEEQCIAVDGQVDQCAGGRGDGEPGDLFTVDRRQVQACVDVTSDALAVRATGRDEMEWAGELELVEPMERHRRLASDTGAGAEAIEHSVQEEEVVASIRAISSMVEHELAGHDGGFDRWGPSNPPAVW